MQDPREIERKDLRKWLTININDGCSEYTKKRQDIESKKINSLDTINISNLDEKEKSLLVFKNFYYIYFTQMEFHKIWYSDAFYKHLKLFYKYSEWNYETCRLRFFIEAFSGSGNNAYNNPEIQKMGEKLLSRDPNDYWVKIKLIFVYFYDTPTTNPVRRLALCHEVLKQRPERVETLLEVGGVYHSRWYFLGRKKEEGLLAIKYYQLALPKLTFNPALQKNHQNRIKEISSKLGDPKAKARWPGD
jgi:hypothetical protein